MKAMKVALARMGRQGGETSSDSPYLLNGAALMFVHPHLFLDLR